MKRGGGGACGGEKKNPSRFLWWNAKSPQAASRASFLPQPSPSLSSHQPSAAAEREGNREEVTELRFGARRRERLIKSHPYPLTSMSESLFTSI